MLFLQLAIVVTIRASRAIALRNRANANARKLFEGLKTAPLAQTAFTTIPTANPATATRMELCKFAN